MKFVTPDMIARHASKHRLTVYRALKFAQVPMEKTRGVRGIRIPLSAANKFIERQWPGIGPLNQI